MKYGIWDSMVCDLSCLIIQKNSKVGSIRYWRIDKKKKYITQAKGTLIATNDILGVIAI